MRSYHNQIIIMMNITINLKKEKLAVSHVKLNPTLHLSLNYTTFRTFKI